MQFGAVNYSAVRCSTLQCGAEQSDIVQSSTPRQLSIILYEVARSHVLCQQLGIENQWIFCLILIGDVCLETYMKILVMFLFTVITFKHVCIIL